MSNGVENCTAEEFIGLCFADDALRCDRNKKEYKFWDNFNNLDIKAWKADNLKIYDKDKYESLPDPDVNSYNLYEAHIRVWNKQCKYFKEIPEIERNGRCRCELKLKNSNIVLGSDSIMSIYWHWVGKSEPYQNMQKIIDNISDDITKNEEYKKIYDNLCVEIDTKFKDKSEKNYPSNQYKDNILQKFIWCYLHKANTIGGFVVFPRHSQSINQRRGTNSLIDDRFDLTLECIRRAYQYRDFYREDNNPLFGLSAEDKKFFQMFGSFEDYTKFFCLDKSWVKDGKVLSLMDNESLDMYDFNQEPLPQDHAEWWTFYDNIMNRLDARNQQIKEIIEGK